MIAKQKGFYFALFALSILLSALVVVSFLAFFFRNGVKNSSFQGYNYDLLFNITNSLFDSTWESPIWMGRFSFGSVSDILQEETQYF